MSAATLPGEEIPASARVPRLSYFFPAHNEEANLEGLVEEALATLPAIADTFEIIAVDDGSGRSRSRNVWPPPTPTPSGSPTTPRTGGMAAPCARASRRPGTSSCASRTATASSGSRTWRG